MTIRPRRAGAAVAAGLCLCFISPALGFSIQRHPAPPASRWSLLGATTTTTATSDDVLLVSAAAETEQQRSILQRMQQEHDEELAVGFETFAESSNKSPNNLDSSWNDADFSSHAVQVGTAGPDEFILKRGNEVFKTNDVVVSENECQTLVQEAREAIRQGIAEQQGQDEENNQQTTSSSSQRTNSQLGEARVSQLPQAPLWLQQALHERFFPLLESRFGVPASTLTLHDALIIGYGCLNKAGASSQPVHRDSSILSLNVALSKSSDYEGGGTFFEGLAPTSMLQNEQGHVLCHAGGVSHAGRGIDSGERWVLVLFCIAKDAPQLARRCHAAGMLLNRQEESQQASATFQAGLHVAPRDHLLHMSLGSVYMAQGQEREAQLCLANTAVYYPHCGKANATLGRMFLANRKPRAALRRFQAVLKWLNERDLEPDAWMPWRAMGWDARVYGAQATVLCAQYALHKEMTGFATRERLEEARGWLDVASRAAPSDGNIQRMLKLIDELVCSDETQRECKIFGTRE